MMLRGQYLRCSSDCHRNKTHIHTHKKFHSCYNRKKKEGSRKGGREEGWSIGLSLHTVIRCLQSKQTLNKKSLDNQYYSNTLEVKSSKA